MFGYVVLGLVVALVVLLGVVAIICSTSNGADWLQRRWARARGDLGADGVAEAADPLRDPLQRRHDVDATQLGGLARHPVDDA